MYLASERCMSLEQMRPYLALGYSDNDAMAMASEDIDVEYLRDLTANLQPKPWDGQLIRAIAARKLDQATVRRWMDLELSGEIVRACLENDIALESLEALKARGKDRWQIEKLVRAGKI